MIKKKANRLDAIKMIISSKEISSQEELIQALVQEGFTLTQATLSRDLKQLKVAKAANTNGRYVYVLPNDILYKRPVRQSTGEMLRSNGFISLQFSRNNSRHTHTSRLCQQHCLRHRQPRMSGHPGHHSGRRHHHAGTGRTRHARRGETFSGRHHTEYQGLKRSTTQVSEFMISSKTKHIYNI